MQTTKNNSRKMIGFFGLLIIVITIVGVIATNNTSSSSIILIDNIDCSYEGEHNLSFVVDTKYNSTSYILEKKVQNMTFQNCVLVNTTNTSDWVVS